MLTPNTTPVLGIQTCDPVVREGERKTPGTLTSRKSHRQSTEADNHTTHATSNTSASSSLNVMDTPERQCSPVKCSEITSTSHLGVENSDDVLPLEDKIVFHNKMSCDSAAGKSHEEQIIAIIDSEITSLEINTAYDNQSDYPMKLSPPSKLNGTSPSSNGKTYVETSSGLSTTLTRPLTNSGDSIVHLKHNRISPCMEKPSVKSMSTKEVSATKVMPINKQLASSTAFENLVAETLEVRDKKKLFPIKEGKPVALTLESLVAETLDIPTEALISIKPSCVNSEDNSEIGTVDDTLVSAGVVEYPVVGNSPTSVVLESTDACQIAMSTYGGTCDFVTLPINVGDSLTDFTTKSIMTSSYSKVPNQNPSVSYVAASTSGGAAVFPVVSTAQELAITPGGVSVTFITTPEPHSAVLDHMYSDPKHIVTLKALSPTTPLTSVPSKIDSTPLSHPSPHVTWTSVPSKVETSPLLARQSATLPRPNVVPQHPVLVTLPPGEKTEVSMVTSSGTNAVITPSNMIHAIPLTSSTVSHEDLQHIKPSLGNIVIQQNNQPQSHMEVSQVHNGHSVNMGVTHIQIDPLGNMQIVHPSLAVEPSPKSQVKIPTSSPVQVTHAIHLPLQSQPQTGRLPVCASLPPRLSEKKAFGSTQNAITMKPSRPLLQSVVQPKVVFKTPRAPESQVGQHTDTVCATQPSLKYFVKPVSNISSSPQQVLSMHDSTFGMLKYAQKIPAAVVSDISPVITLINQPVAEFIQTSAARSSNVHSFAVSSTSSLTSTHSVTSPSISTAYTSGNIQSSTMLSRVKQVPLKISAPSVMMAQSVAGQQSKSLMTPVDQCLTTQQNGHKGKPIQSTDGVKTVGSLCQKPSSIHRQTSVRLNTTNQDSVKSAVQMTNSILAEALLRSGSSKPPQACTSLTDANISPVVLPSSESANGLSSTGQLEFKTHVLIPESRTQIGNNRKVVFTHKKDRKWVSVRSAHGVMGYRKADNEDPKSNSTVFTDSSQSSVPCSSVSSPPTIVVAKTVIPSLLNNSTTTNSFASLPGVTAVSHNMVVSSPAKGSLQTLPLVKKCQSPVTQSLNINRLHDTPKFTIFREAGQKSVIQARFSEDQQSPKQLPAAVNLTTVVSTPESKCIENKKVIQSIPKPASQPAICTAPATNASHNFRQLLEPKVVSTPKLFMLKSVSQPTQELPDVQSKLSLLQSSASSNSGNIASVNGLMAVNLKPSLHGLDVSASIGAHTLPPRNDPSSAYHKPDSATLDTSGVIADPITSSESLLSKSLCPMQQLSAPRTSSINDVQEESQSKFLSLPQTCVSTDSQPPRIRGILPSQSQLNSDLATYVSLSKNTSITTSLDESSSFLVTVPSVSLEPTDNDSSSTVVQDTDRKKDCGTTTKTSRKTVKKECPHCHKVLSSASGLRRHLLTIHDIAIPSGLLDRYIQRPTPALFAVSSKDKQVKKNLLKAKKESKCSSLNEPSKEFHAVDSECEPKMPDIDLMENKCDLSLRSSENSSEATRSSTSGSSDHQRLTNIKLERRDPESFLSVSETLDSVNSTSENEFVCIHDSGDDTAMPLLMPEVPFPETLHQDADPSAVPTRGRVSSRSMKLAQKRSCPCCENTSPNSAKKCRGNKVKRGNVAGRKGVTLKSPRKT